MLRIFSGALQFALGMLMVRGITFLFKRFIPMATTSFGFLWGLGVEPMYYLKYLGAYIVYFYEYTTAYSIYYVQLALYHFRVFNQDMSQMIGMDVEYIYAVIGLSLIVFSMRPARSKTLPDPAPNYSYKQDQDPFAKTLDLSSFNLNKTQFS